MALTAGGEHEQPLVFPMDSGSVGVTVLHACFVTLVRCSQELCSDWSTVLNQTRYINCISFYQGILLKFLITAKIAGNQLNGVYPIGDDSYLMFATR